MLTLPILTAEQTRQWEEDSWKNGISQLDVIRTVGEDVAKYVLRIMYDTVSDCYSVLKNDQNDLEEGVEQIMQMQQILVLVGPGHNGDDARVAANFLRGKVKEVLVLDVKDTKKALRTFKKLVADRKNFFEPMTTSSGFNPTFILDGMFGIGLNRPLSQDYVDLINAINESEIPRVSIDVPSGLNEEGMPWPVAVRAQFTLMIGTPKRCLTRGESSKYIGKTEVVEDIGLDPDIPAGDLEWIKQVNPVRVIDLDRLLDCHKGDFGHTLILAGSLGYHGAAVLAAKAALDVVLGRAAAVADAEEADRLLDEAGLGVVRLVPAESGGNETGIVVVLGREVGEDGRSVDAAPPERVVRELVVDVPGELLREEVAHACAPEDLRQVARVAEHVGEPQVLHIDAELVAEEVLAV